MTINSRSRVVRRRAPRALTLVFLFPALFARTGGSIAQEAQEPTENVIRPLALKEEMVRDRFRRFEDRVFRLREQLDNAEPENAARLARALERAGELGLAARLDEITELLRDRAALMKAMEVQHEWLSDADRLLAILLQRDSDNEARKQELERLREFHQKIGELLERQRALRGATGQTAQSGRLDRQLEQAIQRLDALLQRQEELGEQTGALADRLESGSRTDAESGSDQDAEGQPPEEDRASELKDIADAQKGLSREAQQLAEDLNRLSKMEASDPADASALQAAQQQTQAAAGSVQQGSRSMSSAAEQMQSQDAGSATKDQQEALEALREARKQLEEARARLSDAKDTERLSEDQQRVARDTESLSQQMQQGEGGESAEGGGQPQQGSSGSGRGQQSLQQAQREMEGATQRLQQSQPDQATENQDRAIEELQQAQRELEQALEQLRKEEREETLRDLEARFRDMLLRQRAINDATVQLDEFGRENFRRAEELQLAELSAKERTLSADAATCLRILEEDGTTIAFPRVVEQLSSDMAAVADRLAGLKVDALTQAIQREIVDTLEQLLEAVQRMQQENQQQGQAQASEDGQPMPLLPPSAELKLLRASQFRINTRTSAIDEIRGQASESPESVADALRTVARRQVECARIAEDMRGRTSQR